MREISAGHAHTSKLNKPVGDPITPMLFAVGCALLVPSIAGVTLLISGGWVVSTNAMWDTIQSMSLAIFVAILATSGLKFAWRRFKLPGRSPSDFLPLRWWIRRRATQHVAELVDELAEAAGENVEKLKALAKALERRDIYTRAHSGRVSRLTADLLARMGLSRKEVELGRVAALLHDVGKLQIPDSILFKPGPLSQDEEVVMQQHPIVGAELAAPHAGLEIIDAIRHHHERVDGEGYPERIRASKLGLIARTIPVCDTYDSLITDRPYRAGCSKKEAFDKLRAASGTQLDGVIVETLIELEQERMAVPSLAIFLPIIPVLKKIQHAFHVSTAPTAVTAVMVVSAATVGGLSFVERDEIAPSPAAPPSLAAPQLPPTPTIEAELVPTLPEVEAPRARALRPRPRAADRVLSRVGNGDNSGQPGDNTDPSPEPCGVAGVTLPAIPVVGCPTEILPLP